MLRVVPSLIFWSFLAASSILLFPVALLIWAVTSPFDRRKVLLHRFTCFWASLYTWTNPAWPVAVENREKLYRSGPCVMVANHLSLLDILILFRLFTHFKWVSKIENFRIPFIGWNMHLNRYIPLKRGDRASVIEMMRRCEETLAQGNPIMMFPEGTRSPNGRMRAFKPGAFDLALRARVPVQPLVIRGSADALPKRGFVLRGRHPISIEVLEVLPPESFEGATVEELTRRTRALIAERLGESESEPAAA